MVSGPCLLPFTSLFKGLRRYNDFGKSNYLATILNFGRKKDKERYGLAIVTSKGGTATEGS